MKREGRRTREGVEKRGRAGQGNIRGRSTLMALTSPLLQIAAIMQQRFLGKHIPNCISKARPPRAAEMGWGSRWDGVAGWGWMFGPWRPKDWKTDGVSRLAAKALGIPPAPLDPPAPPAPPETLPFHPPAFHFQFDFFLPFFRCALFFTTPKNQPILPPKPLFTFLLAVAVSAFGSRLRFRFRCNIFVCNLLWNAVVAWCGFLRKICSRRNCSARSAAFRAPRAPRAPKLPVLQVLLPLLKKSELRAATADRQINCHPVP